MSATNRGTERNEADFYPTPLYCISEFLDSFLLLEPVNPSSIFVLDPCCGEKPYETELEKRGFNKVWNIDLRDDAQADAKADYLKYEVPFIPHFIISNPPYSIAREFVEKAIMDVANGGMIAFLLRLNFFGSQKRKPLFDTFPPKYCFVHSKRPSFRKQGGTDATEYAHFVWQKGFAGLTVLKVL